MSRAKYMKPVRTLNLLAQVGQHVDPCVAASERVTTPNGTFDAWKIEAIGTDGMKMILWIDKRTYRHIATRIDRQS